ncbi:YbaK/EbsC family protein [Paenarthrobacter aurescens]|uniref:Aminoacyl-tRNA deacylase n=1 Tax=Paenarthrobacter aurescens TaxID=43663 RepID=A0A4Y3NDE3_PAEAU|nr:YbaK/EbsC family protein [Paenarthrobacter aurescens]MDO6143564.1 YbaK/EbsC family protein [Paenarthrobacter aurescens]MDO6147412.1 YbaK/EbsC family protein [Paenarthrobacter aurescens]MDO6158656.1 YbaK/EbsC family protein [Paenarthrobacter aurescens]MDO6162639.1 YbaK/EbsC family protein [Paenarthrobacter aurescens]GEB19830.1 aminoacyl-tRNA deacylase [Paenarthrobacter aurescens]
MHKATDPVHDPVLNVRSALTAAGAEDTVRTFEDKVPTAAAAASALGCDVAAITNSLIFELDGEPLLILASGAAKVDTGLVAEKLGTGKIRRAKPDFVLEHTGQEVGGVAPVGHPRKIRTLLDVSLVAHPVLWAGAGDHNSMFSISYEELKTITDAQELQVR